jgi:hypothetical protein
MRLKPGRSTDRNTERINAGLIIVSITEVIGKREYFPLIRSFLMVVHSFLGYTSDLLA